MTKGLLRSEASADMGEAERFLITGRRRSDPMSVSRVSDFRVRRDDAGRDTDLRWTPYCYDAASQRVALVGCTAEVDLTIAPFYYQAQYQQARQLMLVTPERLQKMAAQHAPRFTTPVMIYSTGRAGTTLVSKMFGRLGRCVSVSEPDLHTSLLETVAADQRAPLPALLSAGADLYFQPRDAQATHLVLKFRGMGIELAECLRAAHPDVVEVFLYRDVESYVVSSMRAFSYVGSPLWGARWAHGLYFTRPLLTKALAGMYEVICRFFPLCLHYTPREICRLGPVGMLTLSWLSMMQRAQALRFPVVRYDDLMRSPREVLGQLIVRCRLPDDEIDAALGALDEDSQQGSVVARKKTSRYELTARDRATIQSLLARHDCETLPELKASHAIA